MPINLLRDLPPTSDHEQVDVLHQAEGARIERIVSRGHRSPPGFWYDQREAEWVTVLRGRARIDFDDGTPERELGPGDHLWIPARQRHRVSWTDPDQETIWLAVFVTAAREA